MTRFSQCCACLGWLVLAGGSLAAQQAPPVKCEHAAPPAGMHYVCDNPEKRCYCRLEPDDPKAQSSDYSREEKAKEVVPARRVWVDLRRKTFYCSDKRPATLNRHYMRLTEEEARRRGYKPAATGQCK
jgi:hypothetical protein